MDILKIMGLIVVGGTILAIGIGLFNKKESLNCVHNLQKQYNETNGPKTVLNHGDGGLLMLTPASEFNIKIIGFLSPVQFKNFPIEIKKNRMLLLSIKETGKCVHAMSGFEYITFEGEYTNDAKQL